MVHSVRLRGRRSVALGVALSLAAAALTLSAVTVQAEPAPAEPVPADRASAGDVGPADPAPSGDVERPSGPAAAADGGDGAIYSSDHRYWYLVNGPVVPQYLGTATASPANYGPGDTVTVTFTAGFAVTSCQYEGGGSYQAGMQYVEIAWRDATRISHSPTSLEHGWVYGFDTVSEWHSESSVRYPFQPGDTFSVSFRAPMDLQRDDGPRVWTKAYKVQADRCTSQSSPPNIELGGGGSPAFIGGSDPVASFEADQDSGDPLAFTFRNLSFDREDAPNQLAYQWDFGDGATSTEQNPNHRYDRHGSYPVTLTVTDTTTRTASVTRVVKTATGLVVNSAGDKGAVDPVDRGCDTGDRIGDAPECTLRAALETANEIGGGSITFAIDGSAMPAIAAVSPLPGVAQSTVIDGTSQAGGRVRVTSGGERVLELSGGTSTVRGLSIGGAEVGILLSGGTGHVVEGNLVGVDGTGTQADGTAGAVVVEVPNVTVEGNVLGGVTGFEAGAAAAALVLRDNTIGVLADGVTPLGSPKVGALVGGPNATISGNVVRGSTGGVLILAGAATDALIEGNQVGLSRSATAVLDRPNYGIRVDGGARASIVDNDIAPSGNAGVAVTGSVQAYQEDGVITLLDPDEESATPVTGGKATVKGNRIGVVAGDDPLTSGVLAWAGGNDLLVEGNTVGATTGTAVSVGRGTGHRVVGNTLGSAGHPVTQGVVLEDAPGAVVGGVGPVANTIVASSTGVEVRGGANVRLEGNRITLESDASREPLGIAVARAAARPVVTANAVTGGHTGIDVAGADAKITGNTLRSAAHAGVVSAGARTTVSGNVITGGGSGIAVSGTGVTVADNRVGLAAGSETPVAATGTGIVVVDGKATVRRNLLAGTAGAGIAVEPDATARLRSNRIWSVGGPPIVAPGGPAAPRLTAAVRTGAGEKLRRTLLLSGLPEGDAGTIEVFAGTGCQDPEPRYLTEITRTKGADEKQRIIQVRGLASRDHFTVTYTDVDGSTSVLSACQEGKAYPDGDGDGSPDPIDDQASAAADPAMAVLASDTEQLLLLSVAPVDPATGEGGGRLENVAVGEDPTPGNHPAGWTLPYGALSFRVSGLAPGGRSSVVLTALTGAEIGGSTYWKYGPEAAGGPARWYPFDYDEVTRTGATRSEAVSVAGQFRRAWVLRFQDGGRGDSDGGANGSVTDPGGPVDGAAPVHPPVDPPEPPVIPGPEGPVIPRPVLPPATPVGPAAGALARTGGDPLPVVTQGLLLVLGGALLLWAGRRRRSASSSA